ncbi:MAG: septum formation initiator family protein [Bacteroidota bacterium]
MKWIKKILPIFLNKYIFITILFIVWVVFFDKNNMISQQEYKDKLNQLEQIKKYYKDEIEINKEEMDELSIDQDSISDPIRLKKLEKFAREKYLMKKDSEDIFVITKE